MSVAAAWLAFMVGLLAGGELTDAGTVAIAAVTGAALVFIGFAAAARVRALPRRDAAEWMRLALLSLALGVGLGVANLAANWLIAAANPSVRAVLVDRMTTLDPVTGLVASPLVEEVVLRLFLMSAIAWVAWRVTKRAQLSVTAALVGSALSFALLHLDRPMPGEPMAANYYRVALVTKYTLAGLPLGWIFWRWGLPAAILCHVAANGAHLALQRGLFSVAVIAGAAQPAESVAIRVDTAARVGPMMPIWAWSGHDEPNYTYTPNGKKLLSALAAAAAPVPVYVRVHNLLTSGDGKPALKWGSTNAYTEVVLAAETGRVARAPDVVVSVSAARTFSGSSKMR